MIDQLDKVFALRTHVLVLKLFAKFFVIKSLILKRINKNPPINNVLVKSTVKHSYPKHFWKLQFRDKNPVVKRCCWQSSCMVKCLNLWFETFSKRKNDCNWKWTNDFDTDSYNNNFVWQLSVLSITQWLHIFILTIQLFFQIHVSLWWWRLLHSKKLSTRRRPPSTYFPPSNFAKDKFRQFFQI